MSNLKLGTKVSYTYWVVTWEGTIVGKVFEWQPWVWATYIIESKDIQSETYPYTHFACPEFFLKEVH